jgi:translation initiation factor 5
MTNIGGFSEEDESYRYKMPDLIIKNETNKTVLVNLKEICVALVIPQEMLLHFLGVECCAITKIDKMNRYMINGLHNKERLNEIIKKFINIFLLCPKCNIPEITLRKKGQIIMKNCSACGLNIPIDMSHKTSVWLLKKITNQHKRT